MSVAGQFHIAYECEKIARCNHPSVLVISLVGNHDVHVAVHIEYPIRFQIGGYKSTSLDVDILAKPVDRLILEGCFSCIGRTVCHAVHVGRFKSGCYVVVGIVRQFEDCIGVLVFESPHRNIAYLGIYGPVFHRSCAETVCTGRSKHRLSHGRFRSLKSKCELICVERQNSLVAERFVGKVDVVVVAIVGHGVGVIRCVHQYVFGHYIVLRGVFESYAIDLVIGIGSYDITVFQKIYSSVGGACGHDGHCKAYDIFAFHYSVLFAVTV